MNEFLVKLIQNGGKGSGNFNPGQGRGVGKPASGSHSSSKTGKINSGSNSKYKVDIDSSVEKDVYDYLSSDKFKEKDTKLYTIYSLEYAAEKDKDIAKAYKEAAKKSYKYYKDGPQGLLADKDIYGAAKGSDKADLDYKSIVKERKTIEKSIEKDIAQTIKESGKKISDYKIETFIGQYGGEKEIDDGSYGSLMIKVEKKK